jgi:hypothetical protein
MCRPEPSEVVNGGSIRSKRFLYLIFNRQKPLGSNHLLSEQIFSEVFFYGAVSHRSRVVYLCRSLAKSGLISAVRGSLRLLSRWVTLCAELQRRSSVAGLSARTAVGDWRRTLRQWRKLEVAVCSRGKQPLALSLSLFFDCRADSCIGLFGGRRVLFGCTSWWLLLFQFADTLFPYSYSRIVLYCIVFYFWHGL